MPGLNLFLVAVLSLRPPIAGAVFLLIFLDRAFLATAAALDGLLLVFPLPDLLALLLLLLAYSTLEAVFFCFGIFVGEFEIKL